MNPVTAWLIILVGGGLSATATVFSARVLVREWRDLDWIERGTLSGFGVCTFTYLVCMFMMAGFALNGDYGNSP